MEKRVGKAKLKSAVLYSSIILIWVYLLFAADLWKGMRVFCIVLVVIVIGIVIPGISSVSYTHLDVYKRQVFSSWRGTCEES